MALPLILIHLHAHTLISVRYFKMVAILQILIVAAFMSKVQARNETMLYGWQPEPNGRGTWSLAWSCLATIFICTWSALHLDVPHRHVWYHFIYLKIGWLIIAALMPEYMLFKAASNFCMARKYQEALIKADKPGWDLTQMQFALASGFWLRAGSRYPMDHPDIPNHRLNVFAGRNGRACTVFELKHLLDNKKISSRPPVPTGELKSRGKSDMVVKVIAILQISWFGIQELIRAIQHLQLTAIEIMTAAFVVCSLSTYGLSWKQPQNVEYPVYLDMISTGDAKSESSDLEPPTTPMEGLFKKRIRLIDGDMPIFPSGSINASVKDVTNWAVHFAPYMLLILSGCVFGAVHCFAWNSPFPTSQERLAWRICSATTTALPALLTLRMLFQKEPCIELDDVLKAYYKFPIAIYILGRLTIIILALMSLRALPANIFQTIEWTLYLPHFL